MKRKMLILPLAVLLAAPALFAEKLPDVFPLFLAKLTERHEELNTLAIPDVEILTASGYEGEAAYITVFKTTEDGQRFYAALEKENIPCLTFPNNDKRIGLFHTDLLVFLMKAGHRTASGEET